MANEYDNLLAPAASGNPYDDALRGERQQTMRVNMMTGVDANPDTEARVQDFARRYNLPAEAVRLELPQIERRAKVEALDYDTLARMPATAKLLENPDKARLVHDDVQNLQATEDLFWQRYGTGQAAHGKIDGPAYQRGDWQVPQPTATARAASFVANTGSAIASSVPKFNEGAWGLLRAGGDLLPDAVGDPVAGFAARMGGMSRGQGDRLMPKASGLVEASWYSGMQSFGLNMLQLPLAFASGGGSVGAQMAPRMSPMLASMGLTTGGQAYGEARDKGVGVGQSLAFGASQGVIEAGTEMIGMPALFSLLKPGKFATKALEYMLKEQGGEQIATHLQDLNEWAVLNPEKSFADYLSERPNAALQTALSVVFGGGAQVATMKGVGWAMNRAEHQQYKAQQAEASAALMGQLNELAKASKVLQRDPATFEEFIAQAAEDSPVSTVYIDGQALMQSGMGEMLMQVSPSVAAQLNEAAQTGGTVAIPVSEYAARIAPTEQAQALQDLIRTDPDGFSRAEAQQFMATEGERLQADLERTIADAEQGDAFRASADAVRDSIKSQLDTANRFRPEVNDAYSRIVGAYFATRAAQLGITPEELFKRYPLKIGAERIDGQQFDQGGMRVIYRGTNDSGERIKGGISEGALFAAADEATAKSYAGTDGTVEQIGVKPDAKILIEGSTEYAKVTGRRKGKLINTMRKGENLLTAANEVAEQARAAGYDAIEFTSMKDMGIAIFNEDKFVRGYSDGQQLNQAAFDPDHARQGGALDGLRAAWQAQGIDAQVSERGGVITLSKIVVPESERGAGRGTAAMQALVGYADATGQHLALTPSADFGGNKKRLTEFYKRFGFVENKGKNRAFTTSESMYRPASGKVLYQSGQAPDSVDAEVQRQLAETERAYGGRAAYDKAKAEGKTKLTYGQWVQVRTPNFKNWFGDWESDPAHASKVVDRDTGEPMVVYHGSDRGDIHEFHEGGHFGDSGQAADRLTQTERLGAIYPVWLHVADPMRSMDVGDDLAWDRAMIRAANGGHDGIVYRNDTEGPGRDSWLVWDSLQVKSAIGNRGTFDGTTGNILYQGPRGSFNIDAANKAAVEAATYKFWEDLRVDGIRQNLQEEYDKYATVDQRDISYDGLGRDEDGDLTDEGLAELERRAQEAIEAATKERAGVIETLADIDRLGTPLQAYEAAQAWLEAAGVRHQTLGSAGSRYLEVFSPGYVAGEDGEASDLSLKLRFSTHEQQSRQHTQTDWNWVEHSEKENKYGNAGESLADMLDAALRFSRGEKGLGEKVHYQGRAAPRGSFSPEQLTISLLKGADLSTFLHESAHFFYENDIALAAQIAASQQQGASITAGEQQILADVGTLLTWHGLKGDVGAQLTEWYNLPFEERRAHHERTAESFEAYLFEGKAPSIELAPYFQRFRSWLVRVYASLKDFLAGHPEAGTLTPEVRQVFDRMLATNDAIVQMEQARSMLPLFESAEQGGLSPEAWAQYQQDNAQQTQDAVQDLQARSLRDLQWARNARSRQLKRLQREANDLRKAAGVDAWREVMQQPVYRAWRFLTGKITEEDRIGEAPDASPQPSGRGLNPEVDSLLVAIAKLGGIARESAGRDLGVHADDQVLKGSVFGAPPFRKEGGLSADAMAERLLEAGYLLPDEHGKADLRELEELVTGELSGSPAYSVQWNMRSAMPEMQAGEQAVDPSQLGAGRLDKGSLGDMYGPSDARIAQLTGLRMTASKGALHPDIVAELFGFDSGDALVQALLEATPLREAVGAATDQIMLERHGELATPEAIEQAADMAVHNEARGRAVATELAALTKATGKPKLLADAARQFAAEAIARLKVRELIPSRFSNAQAKAARNAKDAMKAGDLAKAGAEKRNELLQHYSAKAAFDAREEVEKARKYLRKFDGDVKGLDPAYLSQITMLLGKYELRAHSLKDAERAVNLRAWVQSRLNDGEIPSLSVDLLSPAERAAYFAEVASRDESGELVYQEDEDAIKLLADAIERSAKRSYKDLTVEEFRGLVDTVRNIEHLGRLKDTLLTARDQKSYEAVRNEMAAGIVAEAKTSGKNTPTATDWWGKKVQGIKGFLTSHIKAASWARVMDGGRDNGPVWRYLIQPANERATQETAEKAKATEDLSAILGPILKDASLLDKSGKGRYFPSIGRSLNLQGRLAVALNYGNESNLQRLLGGDGWTQEQIMPVLQSLTAKEWQAVQAVWDYMESYWPRIVAKELRVTGKAPERIPARAFTVRTADGQTLTLRGGYFPVVFDPRTNMKADADAKAQEAKEMQRAAYSSATTRRSFIKQRVEELHGRPLLLSLQGLYSGVNDVIHDLAWHEWVLDANKLLKSKTIDAAIREHYGPEVKHELEKWRDDVVMNQRRLGHATERFVGFARQNISAAALSFSVWSAIQQPLGLVNSGARIGWHWLGRGVADYIASPFATTREVMEKSAWMQNRTRTRFRELNELRNTVQGQTAAKELMGRYGYWMMVRMQLLVDIPTWRGAYAKAVAEGHDERTAVNLADQGVKDAQGGGEEVDQAGVERGSAYAKLFTVFYSYMGSTLNTAYTSAKTDKNKARAAANILLIVTVPTILQSLLRDALTPGDDDDDPEKLAKKLAGEQLSFLFGLLVGGREFSQTAKGLFGGTGGFSGYSGPAGLRMVSDVDRLATQAKQGEFDEAFVKASISVLGDLSGLPSVQINRTITGVKAMAEGKTDNPLALAFGFQKQ